MRAGRPIRAHGRKAWRHFGAMLFGFGACHHRRQHAFLRLLTFSKKALSKLVKESRPRAEGCGDAKQNRRRGAAPNTIALDVASQPEVIQTARSKAGAVGFKRLAEERINNFRSYPLEVLAVAFEMLMHNFIFKVRSQCRKLIFGIERSRKSTKRPHIFGHLRMAMLGRDENRSRRFSGLLVFVAC